MRNRIWKKSLCILLSAVMVFMMACGKEEVDKADGTGNAETTENTETGENTAAKPENADLISSYEADAMIFDESIGNATSCAVSQYTYASLLLEEAITADYDAMSEEEAMALLDEALLAYERADVAAQHMEQTAVESLKSQRMADMLAVLSVFKPVTVYAASSNQSAVEWAESVTKTFDEGKPGKQVRHLAMQLGTDAKHAYKQLQMAQDILKGKYAEEEGSANEAIALLEATKTSCKVGVFLTAVAITAGAAGAGVAGAGTTGAGAAGAGAAAGSGAAGAAVSTSEVVGLVISGVDTVLEVSTEGSKIIYGEDNKITQNLSTAREMYSNATLIFGITQLDPKKAVDSLLFLGDVGARLYEEGKIGSIQVMGNSEGSENTKLEYSCADTKDMNPENLKAIYEKMEVPDTALTSEKIPTPEGAESSTDATAEDVVTPSEMAEQMKPQADESFLGQLEDMQPTGYDTGEISLAELGEWLAEQEEAGNDVEWVNEIIDEAIFGEDDWMNADIDGLYMGTMTSNQIDLGEGYLMESKTMTGGLTFKRLSEDSIQILDMYEEKTLCTAKYDTADGKWKGSFSSEGVLGTISIAIDLTKQPYVARATITANGAPAFRLTATKTD